MRQDGATPNTPFTTSDPAGREARIADGLARLAKAGAATHEVRVAEPDPDETAAFDDLAAGAAALGAEPETLAMTVLCALCPGRVTRVEPRCYAVDAARMPAERLARLPEILSRRLFGPGWSDLVTVTPIAETVPTLALPAPSSAGDEKAIDWAACEVRIEDVAAHLSRRVEEAGAAERAARTAIAQRAAEAIDAVKTETAGALAAVGDEIANRVDARIETRLSALLDRLTGAAGAARAAPSATVATSAGVLESAVAERLDSLAAALSNSAASPAADPRAETARRDARQDARQDALHGQRAALEEALSALRLVMTDMRSRSEEVARISARLKTLRGAAPTAPTGATIVERAASAPAAERRGFSLSLGGAPLLPTDVALQQIAAEASRAARA